MNNSGKAAVDFILWLYKQGYSIRMDNSRAFVLLDGIPVDPLEVKMQAIAFCHFGKSN